MTKVDQFESVFRSAARTVFQAKRVEIDSVLVVCDGDGSAAEEFAAECKKKPLKHMPKPMNLDAVNKEMAKRASKPLFDVNEPWPGPFNK